MNKWVGLAIFVGLAVAPLIPVWRIRDQDLVRARDWWLLGVAAVAVMWLAVSMGEVWAAVMAAGLIVQWRWSGTIRPGSEPHMMLPSLVTWAAIIGVWMAAQAVPPWAVALLPRAWLLVAVWQGAMVLGEWGGGDRIGGTMGQRTMTAAYLAMMLPFALAGWPGAIEVWAVAAIVVGLVVTGSWLAWGAAFAAVAVLLDGWVAPLATAAAIAVGVWASTWLPRGDTLDTLWERVRTWRVLWHHLMQWPTWAIGRGPYQMVYDLLRWDARYRHTLIHGHAHCEPLELWYEYGLFGVVAMAALTWRVWPHLAIGDPWTAALIAGVVVMGGTIGARVTPFAAVWWAVAAVVGAR